jgi:AcrR family transcriptional regulator
VIPYATGTRRDKRRQAMLDAAAGLFSEKGYEATTLSEVVARSGGSLSTLYELFGSKAGLLVAMVAERCQRLTAVISDVAVAGLPLEAALGEIGRYGLSLLTNADSIGLLRIVIAESPRQPELGRLFYEAGPAAGRRILGRYLADEAERGALVIDDPEAAAIYFSQMLLGDLQMRALCALPVAEGDEADAHIARTVAAFMRLYAAPATPPR